MKIAWTSVRLGPGGSIGSTPFFVLFTLIGYNLWSASTGQSPCTSMAKQSRLGLSVLCGTTTCRYSSQQQCKSSFWNSFSTVKTACDPWSAKTMKTTGKRFGKRFSTPRNQRARSSSIKVYFLWKGKQHLPSPIAIHLVLVLRGGAYQSSNDSRNLSKS